jgi:segregation and condensation protein B
MAVVTNLSEKNIENIITELNKEYITTSHSFRIENIAGGYKMFTLPEYHPYITRVNGKEKALRLSAAGLEVLAVVAYKQPITKAEIERIRGVDCGGVIKNLASKSLVKIDGRSPAPGKPLLYATTDYFLEFFGLPSLEHLPPLAEVDEIKEGLPKLKFVKKTQTDDGGITLTDESDMSFNDLDTDKKNKEEPAEKVIEVVADSQSQSSGDE